MQAEFFRLRISKIDILLALSSGILTALSFPKFNLSFFAWISLIPLFFIILKHKPKQSFFLGLIAGFSHYALLIYWIPSVPAHYGNISLPVSLFIYIIFVLYLSLFWAFFALFFSLLHQSFPRAVFILCPFLWISFEYILTNFLTGFPWELLGYSQFKNLPLIQMASITGVYGISWVIVLLQSMFLFSIKWRKKAPFFMALAFVLLLHGAGLWSLRGDHTTENSFKGSVIQGNVSSDIYWHKISFNEINGLFERHIELSHQVCADGARLIIWPEFSVPLCFSCSEPLYQDFKEKLFQFVKDTESTLLLGTNEIAVSNGHTSYFNTALCLSPELSISQYYKMHLVPFGEYTPYKKIFSFIEKMTHAIGDITPGEKYSLHQFETLRFGSPICYEIIFPNLVRKFVKKGAHFLVTITNDGWYGKSSAPYQHFSMAVLRAIENRRYLLRAATTGVSGIIDPYGRILSKSEMMTKTYLTGEIVPSRKLTIYTKYGDILSFFSLTFVSLSLILTMKKRIHERKKANLKRVLF